MAKPTLDITIDKNGAMTVHVSGASGKKCLSITEMVKEIVGREESRRLTSE